MASVIARYQAANILVLMACHVDDIIIGKQLAVIVVHQQKLLITLGGVVGFYRTLANVAVTAADHRVVGRYDDVINLITVGFNHLPDEVIGERNLPVGNRNDKHIATHQRIVFVFLTGHLNGVVRNQITDVVIPVLIRALDIVVPL
ncbi:hypothetical protein FJN16_13650, partial [Tannerella forsythia]